MPTQLPLTAAAPDLLYDEHKEQLSAADLRTFDHERAALAQLGFGLEKKLLFLEELQIQDVTSGRFAARIYTKRKILARSKPVLLAGLQSFGRLAKDIKVVVPEKFSESLLEFLQFNRGRGWFRHIIGNDQAAPNGFSCRRRVRRAHHQRKKSGEKQPAKSHNYFAA